MRFGKLVSEYFASYDRLEFDFSDLGLILVHGQTGAGKSTLQDMSHWALTGESITGCNADEIRSWNSPNQVTSVTIEVDDITVVRKRGRSHENDFYWTEPNGEVKRGKDATETQKLLYTRLNLSYNALVTGSTFNEFSSAGSFFTAKGKERKEFFETLADLSLPIKLTENVKNEKTAKKKELNEIIQTLQRSLGERRSLERATDDAKNRAELWTANRSRDLLALEERAKNFEAEKEAKISDLNEKHNRFSESRDRQLEGIENLLQDAEFALVCENDKCQYCGQPNKAYNELKLQIVKLEQEFKLIESQKSPYSLQIETAKSQTNRYVEDLEKKKAETNPFIDQEKALRRQLFELASEEHAYNLQKTKIEFRLGLLEKLQDLCSDLRVELLRKAVYEVQENINKNLELYFDSELRVAFELKDGDSLQVTIYKGDKTPSFKRLSRGQRSVLRLCFILGVMPQVSNKHGLHFDCLFFDEVLDGMDEGLKVKSFKIFEELSLKHKTILLTDHNSEFKNLFSRKFVVKLIGDVSKLEEEYE